MLEILELGLEDICNSTLGNRVQYSTPQGHPEVSSAEVNIFGLKLPPQFSGPIR